MVLDPLGQIHLVTMAAIIVIFLVTLLLLRRICFLPLIAVMDQRAARIEAARTRKAEAEALLKSAQLETDQILSAAHAEAERLVAQVVAETAGIRSERMAKASAEAEAILAKGREGVLAVTQSEDARLTEELCACVGKTLTTMIGPVDDTAVRFMVNRVVTAKEAR
jgi:F-type H+-transporting ATPase subunit b